MTQRSGADAMAATSPRVPCPLRGSSVDIERCLTCAYFNGATICASDPRELAYSGPSWWRLLVP